MILSIIVAMDEDGVIGRAGSLPWHLPDDLRRFKAATMGHVLVMGRRTLDSIGRALPGRRSVVLTRNPAFRPPEGVEVAADLRTALLLVAKAPQVFVVGGASVYREALPSAHQLLITRIHARVPGDVHFPPVAWDEWALVEDERHPADARHAFPFSFRRYARRI